MRTRLLAVKRVEDLGRSMRRVALAGTDLAGFDALGPTDHAKVFLPDEARGVVVLPEVRDGAWLNRRDPALTWRDYTVRTYDPTAGEVVFDLAVHPHGPGGRWAGRARPGDQVAVLGPGTSKVLALSGEAYLLAADEAGLPALLNWLDRLPASVGVLAFVEVDGPDCEVPIAPRAGLSLSWVHRGGRPAGSTTLLRDAVAWADVGRGWRVWGAGEASSMRALRWHLVQERGLARSQVDVTGYWRAGVVHFDHKSAEARD